MKTLKTRIEKDVFGDISIPTQHYWGSNTQRSLEHFSIGTELMPLEFIYMYALFKACTAKANHHLGLLNKSIMTTIVSACDDIIHGKYNDEFPLHIWQTGSGTQTNMNVNEVIANICNKKLTGKLGTKTPIHPNNHVNMSQSSNDSFISVIHVFVSVYIKTHTLPAIQYLHDVLKLKSKEFHSIIKIGRTHLQDAVPITFGQEFSGYVGIIHDSMTQLEKSLSHLHELAVGGTAVGTGLNTIPDFGPTVCTYLESKTKIKFVSAPNKFSEMSSHNAVLEVSNALKVLATNISKIANDIRLMGSGPKAGFYELKLPQNEPGSSIMPGKVNPTQCEAAIMASVQVIANNLAITIANTGGQFELNAYNPLMLLNITQSMRLMTDVCTNLTKFCIRGLKVNRDIVKQKLDSSLTLATSLNKHIGYDKATTLVHYAYDHGITLQEANQKLKYVSDADLNKFLDPRKMIHTRRKK
jgi:fumarate hydratase class II